MRGFEFPKTLLVDIDKIRYMEGVPASSEFFDAVIDKIKSLLMANSKNIDNTKFSVFEDPDFFEDVIQDIIIYHLLKHPIPEAIKDKVNKSLLKYYSLHTSEMPKGENKGVPGRNVLHTVQYGGKWYNLYDVFYKDEKKYAYGLVADTKPMEQQTGAFFYIDNSDNIRPILLGTSNAMFPDVEASTLFTWYTKNRRGLGGVPDILLPLLENQMRSFSVAGVNTFSDFIGLDNQDINAISEFGIDKIISHLRATNENLLYARVSGIYNGLGVFLGDGNCYGNRFQGYYAGRIIRTPIREKVILDIDPQWLKTIMLL